MEPMPPPEQRLCRIHGPQVFDPQFIIPGPEAARLLGISRRTLRRWCAEKPPRLTFIPLSKNKVGFRKQILDFYLQSREIRGRYHVEIAA